jgi:hypothetical protein
MHMCRHIRLRYMYWEFSLNGRLKLNEEQLSKGGALLLYSNTVFQREEDGKCMISITKN